jgi:hypothetical protein
MDSPAQGEGMLASGIRGYRDLAAPTADSVELSAWFADPDALRYLRRFLHDERTRELGAADPVVFDLAKTKKRFCRTGRHKRLWNGIQSISRGP